MRRNILTHIYDICWKLEDTLSTTLTGALWSIKEKKHRQNSHPIIHCPTSEGVSEVSERTSERSGGRERSEQSGASERVSGASEWANGRASGPVLQSVFLAVFDHSAQFSVTRLCKSPCWSVCLYVFISHFAFFVYLCILKVEKFVLEWSDSWGTLNPLELAGPLLNLLIPTVSTEFLL